MTSFIYGLFSNCLEIKFAQCSIMIFRSYSFLCFYSSAVQVFQDFEQNYELKKIYSCQLQFRLQFLAQETCNFKFSLNFSGHGRCFFVCFIFYIIATICFLTLYGFVCLFTFIFPVFLLCKRRHWEKWEAAWRNTINLHEWFLTQQLNY